MSQRKNISIKFKLPDGSFETVKAEAGQTLMEIAHANDLPLECACGGALSCSTCHLKLEPVFGKRCAELQPISDDEADMLDVAHQADENSRLGCQIVVDESWENACITIPKPRWAFLTDAAASEDAPAPDVSSATALRDEIEILVEHIHEKNPDAEVLSISFSVLKTYIEAIDGFETVKGALNERVLETVQMRWYALSVGNPFDED